MQRALEITQASRSVANRPLTFARLGLRTKCYWPITNCEGQAKGESDV